MRRSSVALKAREMATTVARNAAGNSNRKARGILIGGGAALCALLLPTVHRPALRLVWNFSASVPVGLYRIVSEAAPRRGELVALRPSPALARYMAARRYVEAGALLVKPVAAIAGQRVCRKGLTVTIDVATVATALVTDSKRRPLPTWMGCRRLRSGTLFPLSPAVPASFDGRYFGPVAISSVVGRAVPLWTWQ